MESYEVEPCVKVQRYFPADHGGVTGSAPC